MLFGLVLTAAAADLWEPRADWPSGELAWFEVARLGLRESPSCIGFHAAPFRSPSMAASNDVGSLGENPLIASPLAPIRNDGVPVSPAFFAARASPAISLASSGSRRSLAQRTRSRPVTWLAMPWRYASVT